MRSDQHDEFSAHHTASGDAARFEKKGREYAELLGNVIDSDYEPKTESLTPPFSAFLTGERADWEKRAGFFMFPFHTLDETLRVSVEIETKFPEATLCAGWLVLYASLDVGQPWFYEAELLSCKRKIYEQGTEIQNFIVIDLEEDLAPLARKYKYKIKDFADPFIRNLVTNCEASGMVKFVLKDTGKVANTDATTDTDKNELRLPHISFSRFNDSSGQPALTADGKETYIWRVRVSGWWLDWAEAAHRAGFDFEYLEQFTPIEMRLYELIQLMRGSQQESSDKSNELIVKYEHLAKLMPMKMFTEMSAIEDQILGLSERHIKAGFIKEIAFIDHGKSQSENNVEIIFKL